MIEPVLIVILIIVFIAGVFAGRQLSRKRVLEQSIDKRLSLPEPVVKLSSWEQQQSFGAKLRKDGRYDEAVQLHQMLLADDEWAAHYQAIQFELAEDFYFSGLYDRAERIYHLTLAGEDFHKKSLLRLASIAARLRDWQRLSELLASEETLSGELAKLYVHSQCEIALRHREHGLHDLADDIVGKLKKDFPDHPRVQSFTAKPASVMGEYVPLVKILQKPPSVARFQQVVTTAQQMNLTVGALHNELTNAGWLARRYQCSYCGYTSGQHQWQCPQCEHWESLQDQS